MHWMLLLGEFSNEWHRRENVIGLKQKTRELIHLWQFLQTRAYLPIYIHSWMTFKVAHREDEALKTNLIWRQQKYREIYRQVNNYIDECVLYKWTKKGIIFIYLLILLYACLLCTTTEVYTEDLLHSCRGLYKSYLHEYTQIYTKHGSSYSNVV